MPIQYNRRSQHRQGSWLCRPTSCFYLAPARSAFSSPQSQHHHLRKDYFMHGDPCIFSPSWKRSSHPSHNQWYSCVVFRNLGVRWPDLRCCLPACPGGKPANTDEFPAESPYRSLHPCRQIGIVLLIHEVIQTGCFCKRDASSHPVHPLTQ